MLARRPWKRAGEDPAWSWEPQSKALAVVGATGQQSPGQVKWCLSQRSCALCEAPKSKRWPRNWMRVYGARGEMEPSWSLGPVLAGGGGLAERLARAFCACTPVAFLPCHGQLAARRETEPSMQKQPSAAGGRGPHQPSVGSTQPSWATRSPALQLCPQCSSVPPARGFCPQEAGGRCSPALASALIYQMLATSHTLTSSSQDPQFPRAWGRGRT